MRIDGGGPRPEPPQLAEQFGTAHIVPVDTPTTPPLATSGGPDTEYSLGSNTEGALRIGLGISGPGPETEGELEEFDDTELGPDRNVAMVGMLDWFRFSVPGGPTLGFEDILLSKMLLDFQWW